MLRNRVNADNGRSQCGYVRKNRSPQLVTLELFDRAAVYRESHSYDRSSCDYRVYGSNLHDPRHMGIRLTHASILPLRQV